jgi:hypothetical protein
MGPNKFVSKTKIELNLKKKGVGSPYPLLSGGY